MKIRVSCVGAFGVVGLAMVCQAHAGVFYGVTDGGKLISINPASQTTSVIGSVQAGPNAVPGLEDCDFDASGNLYAVRSYSGMGFPPPTFNESYRINTSTASALFQANLGATGQPHTSLGFSSASGTYFSVNNMNGNLGTFNPAIGSFAASSGVSHGSPFRVEALAFHPTSGALYGIFDTGNPFLGSNYVLATFNVASGISSVVGTIGPGTYKALRFDDVGTAYTVNGANGNVMTLNLATGAGTVAFAGGAAAVGVTGLAFIPTPGSAGIVLGVLGLAARRRRA